MTIAITGSSGFIGSYLTHYFQKKDFQIVPIKRSEIYDIEVLKNKLDSVDVIINLAGANIINRWTPTYKNLLYGSRVDTTKNLVQAINSIDKNKLLISSSAVGIYEDNVYTDEYKTNYGSTFLTKICSDWEETAKGAQCRVAIFRYGVVLGDGGALKKMLLPFKLGLGGNIGDGKQPFPFIHIEDLARAYEYIINNNTIDGTFNLTAPNLIDNAIFTKTLSKILRRPAFLTIPSFILKLLFGEGSIVLTNGQNAYPKRLIENDFKFKFETIEETLRDLIKTKP